MSRKLISVLLITLLVHLVSTQSYADPQRKAKRTHAEKVKAAVAKVGSGLETRVTVSLRDREGEVKGYISKIDEDSFVITDPHTGITTTIPYWAVRSLAAFNASSRVRVSVSNHGQVVFAIIGIAASVAGIVILAKFAEKKNRQVVLP